MTTQREWCGLILEARTEYGTAARGNRGRYAGRKIHQLFCEYVVGLVEGYYHAPGTFGAQFKQTGQPVLFSCYPLCGCTRGQHAGKPLAGKTHEHVTCDKCKGV